MTAPRLLDLYCGAGGAGKGYVDAGFQVLGVDIEPQVRYPYAFVQMDALDFLDKLLYRAATGRSVPFVAVHASPPCQAYGDLQKQNKRDYPRLIEPTRARLRRLGLPYIIENVDTAPLLDPMILCGTMFPGLRVIRHRKFETSFPIEAPSHPKHPLVFTHDKRKAHYGKLDQDTAFVQVTGGGNASVKNKGDAMGINWMIGAELNEAIPPAYAEYVGRHLLHPDYLCGVCGEPSAPITGTCEQCAGAS